MNPLGATQRDVIRQHSEQDDTRLKQFSSVVDTDDVSVELRSPPKKEKTINCYASATFTMDSKSTINYLKAYFLPKCIAVVIVVLILLAGVIVLIVFNVDKDRAGRGKVLPPDIDQCFDTSVTFGEEVRIKCSFSKAIKGNIEAIYKDTVDAKASDFNCVKVNGTNDVQCTAAELANCKSVGDVEIRFLKDDGKTINFTKTVNLETKGRLEATLNQVYNGSSNQSIFQLSCTSIGYCSSYEMKFVENETEKEIADSMSCDTSYSVESGYVTNCSAEISSDVIIKNFGNRTTMNCQLMKGKKNDKTEFGFPDCRDYAVHKTECNQNTSLYDCSDTSSILGNCTAVCEVARQCFSLRFKEFSKKSSTCTECALKWCRNDFTREIDTSGALSFENLCPIS